MVISRDQASHLRPNVLRPGTVVRHINPSKIRIDKSAKPKMVIADDGGYVWFLSKKGTVTGYATDCSGAEGGIVDHKGRVVVACTNSGTVNVYNKGNTTGPADTVLNEATFSPCCTYVYPAAAFEDASGNIYATNLYSYICSGYYCNFGEGTIAWWSTSNQSTGAYPSGSYQDPNLYEDFFADIDSSGTVYVDGYSQSFSPEVDQVTNITTSPTATNQNITLNFMGLIYAMGNGNLAIGDQGCYGCGNNALYIYNDPPTAVSATLKSPQNIANTCDPVAGGFSSGDSQVLIGDAGCRAGDLGNVSANTWKNILNINFSTPIGGMFLKSDK